jgi:Domain of unknown function (DUF932)
MSATATSTLMVHCGGVRRTRNQLAGLGTPAATATWKPVPHYYLVTALVESLAAQGAEIVHESYCTLGRDDAKVLGTIDLRLPDLDTPDFRMGLGLRASNDKSCAIQLVAACRVFVCDNWAFSGSSGAVFLRAKHTSGLDIRRKVPSAVDQFLERAGLFRLDIDRMRNSPIADGRAKQVIYDVFAGGMMPMRLFDDVHRLYFDDDEQRDKFRDRTLWSLNNACTEAVKVLRPAPQHAAGLSIGRLFGRLVHRIHEAPPTPIATVDGIDVFEPGAFDARVN